MRFTSLIRRRIAAIALVSAAFVGGSGLAQAQGILDIGRIIIGLPTEQKDPIDYRERAPIVVPPNQNLRPPREAAPADQRRANWPQDPDIAARRRAAEDARKPANFDSVTGREMPARRMTLDEIRAGRVAGTEVPQQGGIPQHQMDPLSRGPINIFGGLATLREMDQRDAAGARSDSQLGRVEPPREFLTDPPVGTRAPAAGAPVRATREGKVGAREDPKPFDIFREGPNTR